MKLNEQVLEPATQQTRTFGGRAYPFYDGPLLGLTSILSKMDYPSMVWNASPTADVEEMESELRPFQPKRGNALEVRKGDLDGLSQSQHARAMRIIEREHAKLIARRNAFKNQ